jgi:molecular chaperone HscA
VEKIIPRNTTIPAARAQEFTTYKDGQTAMSIQVLQGERELVSDCRSLAKFELRGIPPMAAGAARIRVTFQVDADGLLSVSAQELHSGVQAAVSVKPAYGLADDEITRMLKDSYTHAKDDIQARALQEARVDAERLLDATQTALNENGATLLDATELAAIEIAMDALRMRLSGTDHRAIKDAAEALNQATHEFAGRRMDASVKRALAGQRIEAI